MVLKKMFLISLALIFSFSLAYNLVSAQDRITVITLLGGIPLDYTKAEHKFLSNPIVNEKELNSLQAQGLSKDHSTRIITGRYFGGYDCAGYSEEVFLVRVDLGVDAATIIPVAAQRNIPIIMTDSTFLPSGTIEYLTDLRTKKITIIGGTIAVNESIKSALENNKLIVNRVWGKTRYETSLDAARRYYPSTSYAVLVNGENETEALLAAPFAKLKSAPLILVKPYGIPESVKQSLKDLQVKRVYVIGTVSPIATNELKQMNIEVLEKISASDLVSLSVEISKRIENEVVINKFKDIGYNWSNLGTPIYAAYFLNLKTRVVVLPSDMVESYTLFGFAANKNGSVLLTPRNKVSDQVASWLQERKFRELALSMYFSNQVLVDIQSKSVK
ncbi:MAG: cell wall-binding repeat-containing protein [Euryarchaeota archaeon]|nr:cell wall-binding repeat-containing protein [Euryarchaeota archaeon]